MFKIVNCKIVGSFNIPKTEDLVFFLGANRIGPNKFIFDDGSIFTNNSLRHAFATLFYDL